MSKKKVSYAITDNNVTVNYDGQTHIVARQDALADKLIAALREGRSHEIPDLVSAAKRIEKYGRGDFVVQDGLILVNGQPVHEVLSRKILRFQSEGLPHRPLVRFAENLQNNPSYRAVTELFTFLEKNDHPITEEGNFIAYKKVRDDYKDVHSGTFDNSPGQVVEMPRNMVNEDSTQTCSHGLHAANYAYASSFYAGGLMLELEINPADVVSIPVDYDNAKMRVCKYKVLGVVDSEHSSDTQFRNLSGSSPAKWDDEEEEEEEEENTCSCCGVPVEDWEEVCEDCEECDDDEDEDDSDYPFDRETF